MKKLILILSTTAFMFSCSSPLDKKVVIGEFADVMEQLKVNHPEYSEADFERAGEDVNKSLFGSMMSGESLKVETTYRELLDNAKAKNEELARAKAAKEAEREKLRKEFEIAVTNGEYFHDSGKYSLSINNYRYVIKLNNHSNKAVTAFQGRIVFRNEKGDELLSSYIDEAFKFPAGETAEATETTSISSRDNLTELEALPFDKITAMWEPSLLIFEDGSRMEVED